MNLCSKYQFLIKYYKKKLQDVNRMLPKPPGCFYDVWISWGICIHSSCSSLDFLVFYIESKQEISFIYYLLEANEPCFNSSCLWLFSTWPFFSEVSFHHSFKYFRLLRQPDSWFERQKFRDENRTFSGVCICVYVL